MSTNNDVSVATELEQLESEKLIGEQTVSVARDRYASELGNAEEIERMRRLVGVQPKTYKIPKRLKKERNGKTFLEKMKKLLGLAE